MSGLPDEQDEQNLTPEERSDYTFRHHIRLNEHLQFMLNDLIKSGFSASEVFRAGLRLLHRKEFPLYKVVTKGKAKGKVGPQPYVEEEEFLNPQEYCHVILGGEVVEKEGLLYCRTKRGNLEVDVPLKQDKYEKKTG